MSEKEFHDFLSHRHGVECAKIHEKYGVLKYQMPSQLQTRFHLFIMGLAESMKMPYTVNDHDLEIEYYFKDVASLLALSADQDFKDLHAECVPYVNIETTKITLTWIEVYLKHGKLVNVGSEGKSSQPSFEELSDIKSSDAPVAKYY
ncbi:hypothetical protein LQW54_004071 [Pestalotiopsis sp. IQ-011]